MPLRIAVDGPAGSGKSTISKIIAEKLNLIYIDTGAMYRACAYISIKYALDDASLVDKLQNCDILFRKDGQCQRVILEIDSDELDVTDEIRGAEVTAKVPETSKIKEVREILTRKQQEIASKNDVIMDGRDIGTVVIPDAEYKFYLDASAEERAKRRFDELKDKGEDVNFEDVLRSVIKRDFEDMNREIAPLRKADDAILIDTSNMTIDEVANKILERVLD
ncbi:(d)CMP kinase [Deferribacterales bacterium Es71-Z0220]|uniref:(d)CMP kinase n=1 Tax=Deferrivibrio essentukiensis TaxID=2880922 RepID=UPI001F6107EB|nr:(d)CMP kinase [Deferrivibrio essentukiensis]MCB4203663.1 (d)CMP kinase [Deferrivibrio essentukiensis]